MLCKLSKGYSFKKTADIQQPPLTDLLLTLNVLYINHNHFNVSSSQKKLLVYYGRKRRLFQLVAIIR